MAMLVGGGAGASISTANLGCRSRLSLDVAASADCRDARYAQNAKSADVPATIRARMLRIVAIGPGYGPPRSWGQRHPEREAILSRSLVCNSLVKSAASDGYVCASLQDSCDLDQFGTLVL